ncbi:hypothetical protein V1478_007536 [Vespula squamosa]|uniref:Uncharacterized protein n=1 Tax=Vespula squamosa TaxID=30214 RepID=A0ABD2B3D6_VESSQ
MADKRMVNGSFEFSLVLSSVEYLENTDRKLFERVPREFHYRNSNENDLMRPSYRNTGLRLDNTKRHNELLSHGHRYKRPARTSSSPLQNVLVTLTQTKEVLRSLNFSKPDITCDAIIILMFRVSIKFCD